MVLESVGSGLDYLFGVALSNINFLRVLLAVVIFSFIYRKMYDVLHQNKSAAIVVSVIVAFMGVRFMPAGILLNFAAFIWVIVFIAVPYLLLAKIFRKWWQAVLAALGVAVVLLYLLRGYLSISLPIFGWNFSIPDLYGDLWYILSANAGKVAIFIAAVIVVIGFLRFWFKRKGGKTVVVKA